MSCAEVVPIPVVHGLYVYTYVCVCNCGGGGSAFLTMGLLNDVCREGFLLTPFSHLKDYSFGAPYGRRRLIGIISGQFIQVVRHRSWYGMDFLPEGSVSSLW